MNAALEISNLRKSYKGFVLKDISFSIPAGTIMGLIGPNGAGKTTVIKLVMNLIRREAGAVRIFGRDNIAQEPEAKARIGFVYDEPCFPPDVSLGRIASAVAPFYPRWDGKLFARTLEEFDLSSRKKFKTLSHGMKMKFALALALAHDADLILMDEPTSGLDPVFRHELLVRLSTVIQDERKSVLFSTHLTSDLEKIADHVTLIHEGAIVFSAPKDEILETYGLVKAGGRDVSASEIPGLKGCRHSAYGLEALTAELEAARRSIGPRAVYERASLEDIMYFISKGEPHA
ncbi:MAG: ABC transporter ATP-binding protein [Candidatus Aminicenantes bacterium]|nr:ABC transporter ATP-binding protein [Candidatus Aminicenantes bacterium]